jgi:crotonobetainyl-CoA:carnitine CoA-transferase CaiB-like acyl-CoA transferase
MRSPMEGIKVLEVAQFTFVPSAGAVLADWGADVIKVEHSVNGDAQRGLIRVLGHVASREGSSFAPTMEGPNRSKRSIGLSLDKPEAKEILEDLVRQSDVFLTNFLPAARRKLGIDVDAIRAINPDIIYASGSGFGQEGPEAENGAYDATAFWARGGSAYGTTTPDAEFVTFMPSGGYGDCLGGMAIAGGIAAALFARAQTGEAATLDVSLLGLGAWATQFVVNLASFNQGPIKQVDPRNVLVGNPLVGNFRTSDQRWIQLSMLQPGRYWAEFVTNAGRPELASDSRFATAELIMENYTDAIALVTELMASKDVEEWKKILGDGGGQWALVTSPWELANDESLKANGRLVDIVDADGATQTLVANPVAFAGTPVPMTRAPGFAEHTDEVMAELGIDEERLIELKIAGAIT